MHLVQISAADSRQCAGAISPRKHSEVWRELTERFGGLTVYTRAPAEGLWKLNENHTSRDDIVIFEVMVSELNMAWWREYRQELEKRFRQDVVMVRAQQTQSL